VDILNPNSVAHHVIDIVVAIVISVWIFVYSKAKLRTKLGLFLFLIFVFWIVEYYFPVLLGPSTDPRYATRELISLAFLIGFVFYVLFFGSE
jgi:hypothetical protein